MNPFFFVLIFRQILHSVIQKWHSLTAKVAALLIGYIFATCDPKNKLDYDG